MSDIYVEREDDGTYAATQNHRTIATGSTQRQAIARARRAKPDDPVLAERVRDTASGVRDTASGVRDKWRKVY
jgi:hypothetical protein